MRDADCFLFGFASFGHDCCSLSFPSQMSLPGYHPCMGLDDVVGAASANPWGRLSATLCPQSTRNRHEIGRFQARDQALWHTDRNANAWPGSTRHGHLHCIHQHQLRQQSGRRQQPKSGHIRA